MRSLPLYVLVLWGCSFLVQLVVLVLLLRDGNFRKLPFFTMYTAFNICQVGFLAIVYQINGMSPLTTETLAWVSEDITLVAQALAATEILRIVLKPYQGIWGLSWRLLAGTSSLVIVLVARSTHATWAWAKWFDLNHGYHLTFATALLACLILARYYSIPVPTAYKIILIGFCFYSCTELLINSIFRAVFYNKVPGHQGLWQFSTIFSFVVVLFLWVVALRKPLPVENRQLALTSDAAYQRLSPEINDHLRLLNEKLLRLWKLEARSN